MQSPQAALQAAKRQPPCPLPAVVPHGSFCRLCLLITLTSRDALAPRLTVATCHHASLSGLH